MSLNLVGKCFVLGCRGKQANDEMAARVAELEAEVKSEGDRANEIWASYQGALTHLRECLAECDRYRLALERIAQFHSHDPAIQAVLELAREALKQR